MTDYIGMADKPKKKATPDSELSDIKEKFKLSSDAEAENRERALDCLRFARLGEQWPDKIRQEREEQGRPCLTINVLPSFIRQVTNETRQNKPSIQVSPVDSFADINTAHVLSGVIRNIEQMSNAGVAYDTASDFAVSGGFGYFRIGIEYAHDASFDKDLLIQSVQNPFSIYGDPHSVKEDSSDWNCAFVTELMPRSEFARRFKGAEEVDWDTLGYSTQDTVWVQESSIMLAEYWEREEIKKTLLKLSTGAILDEKTYIDNKDFFEANLISIVGQRPGIGYKVTQKLMTGAEVLETNDWAGKYIPLIPVYGETVNIEGKRYLRSLIADAMDPQRMHNYWRTTATESVALAPKTPFIGPEEAFTGKDAKKWATANNANYSFISHKGPVAPSRVAPASLPAGALNEALAASDDMKRVMGLYDASLGQRSNETSGRAINARKVEGETATFHFPDNLARSITHGARVLIDLIPKVYSGEQMLRIIGPDGTADSVKVAPSQPQQLGMPPEARPERPMLPNGKPNLDGVFNLDVGRYDVVVSVGPSYQTQRQEAADQMTEFVRAFPEAAPIIGDLLVKNLDWPGAEEIAARLKAMLPPQLQEDAQGGLPDPRMQAAQAQIQQLTQAIQEADRQLQEAKQGQAEKIAQAQADMQTAQVNGDKAEVDRQRNAIEYYKAETDRMVAETERAKVAIEGQLTQAQTMESTNSGEALAGLSQAAQAMAATVAALHGHIQNMNAAAMQPKVKRSKAMMPDGRMIQLETTEDAPMGLGQPSQTVQ